MAVNAKFDASQTLAKIGVVLNDTNVLLNRVHLPIADLVVFLIKLDNQLKDVVHFFSVIDNVAKIVHEALQLTKYLAQLIPEVGPILARAVSVIEKFRIEKTLRDISKDLKTIVNRVRMFLQL